MHFWLARSSPEKDSVAGYSTPSFSPCVSFFQAALEWISAGFAQPNMDVPQLADSDACFLAQWAGHAELANGCEENNALSLSDHAVILSWGPSPWLPRTEEYRGIYRSRGINTVHHTSTMKINSPLITNARFRSAVRLLLLLLLCVGYSRGMPHVLRFGELLSCFVVFCPAFICWSLCPDLNAGLAWTL